MYTEQISLRGGGNPPSMQRRKYVRIPLSIEMILYSDITSHAHAGDQPLFVTQDISGGGFSFILTSHANLGTLLIGSLTLTTPFNRTHVPFSGKIVRCEEKRDNRFKISVEFAHMDQSARSNIIRFCRLKKAEQHNKWRNYSI